MVFGISSISNEISVTKFDEWRAAEKITVIDVREKDELPAVNEFRFTHIPLGNFKEAVPGISTKDKIVIFCQSGARSLAAARILHEEFSGYRAYSLKGGILEWKKLHPEIAI